jgi:tetratricopeptide (TPR) repeat protein
MQHGWAEGWRAALAQVVVEQGREEEAEALLERTNPEDPDYQSTRALLLARRGDHEQAERLARAAAAAYESTDATPLQAEMARILAEVLRRGGKRPEAREELERALAIEEGRGAALKAERTRARLADLDSA